MLPVNLNFLKQTQDVHIIEKVKTEDDLCHYCYTEYKNESLKCGICNNSICLRCCNRLDTRSRAYYEGSDIVDNIITEKNKKTIKDLFVSPVLIRFQCGFCKTDTFKSLDKFSKNDILTLVAFDYNYFISPNDKVNFRKKKYDYDILTKNRLIETQLNALVISSMILKQEYLVETNNLKESILQSDIKIKELQIENSILTFNNKIFGNNLLKTKTIIKNHKKIKKLEIIEMLKNMVIKFDIDININTNDTGDFFNIDIKKTKKGI